MVGYRENYRNTRGQSCLEEGNIKVTLEGIIEAVVVDLDQVQEQVQIEIE